MKKQLLTMTLAVAVMLSASACGKTAEKTTTTKAENTASSETLPETKETTAASVEASAEVDHVDDRGVSYYKNPAEWTYNKVASSLTIAGKTFEAPINIGKLGDGFEYCLDEEFSVCLGGEALLWSTHNGKPLAAIYVVGDCETLEEAAGLDWCMATVAVEDDGTDESLYDDFTFCGAGFGSTKDELLAAVGTPSRSYYNPDEQSDRLFYGEPLEEGGTQGILNFILMDGKVTNIECYFYNPESMG